MSAQDDVVAAFGEPRRDRIGAAADTTAGDAEPEADAAAVEQPLAPEADRTQASSPAPATEDESAADEPQRVPPADHDSAADDSRPAPVAEGESASAEPVVAAGEPSTNEPPTGEPGPVAVAVAEGESASTEAPHLPVAETELLVAEPVSGVSPDSGESLAGAPGQLYLDPSAFFSQLRAEVAKPKRRWPRLMVRYGCALLVAGAVAAGTAYGVTVPRRTDVPFLATPDDGRYVFPPLARPVPPVGKPAPSDDANSAQVHFGDLRQYLLPAPTGAVVKEDGWEPVADFVSGIDSPALPGRLYDAGLRRIAWRGWTMPDGQHTVIELFQFPDHQAVYAAEDALTTGLPRQVGKGEDVVPKVTVPTRADGTEDAALRKFDEVDGLPGQLERRAVFRNGDVVAIVTTTAPKTVGDVPTDQVLILQAEMLR